MIWVLYLVFIVLLYLVAEYVRMRWHYHVGTELARNTVPFSRYIKDAKARVLIAGDSTAVGTGARDVNHTVAGRLAAKYKHTYIENIGKNGMKMRALYDLLATYPHKDFDLIILHVGGNDVVFLSDLDAEVVPMIDKLMEKAKEKGKQVILWSGGNAGSLPALPLFSRWLFDQRARYLREIYREAEKKHDIIYIDLYRDRKVDPVRLYPRKYVSSDFFHPNDAGYGLWFEELERVIEEHNIKLA